MTMVGFAIAIAMSLTTETLTKQVNMILALIILAAIIFIGIIFDMIGTAVTAAKEPPFHAMCTKRIPGARQSIKLIRQADKVANFCNDIVGDIANTVGGAAGATIVIRLLSVYPQGEYIFGIVMTSLIAAVTIGGKAVGKSIALKNWLKIIHGVGRIIYWLEIRMCLTLLDGKKNGRK